MGYYFGFLIVAYALQGFLALGNGIRVGSIGTPKYFNVLDYGAIGDGKKDDSQAFLKTWSDLCKNEGGSPTMVAPAQKMFLITPLSFHGPCKSRHVRIKIQGAIVAPNDRGAWRNCENNAWISFSNIDNLIFEGLGVINGQGSIWWHKQLPLNQIQHDQMCNRPKALCFTNCNGLRLSGVRVVDSPAAHIVVASCNDSVISNIRITSPEHSPNTDGIDLSMSTNVQIRDSFIASGDDCIAIGSKTSFVNISGITCGPGHGISIGSLGRNGGYAQVEEIHVRHCTFNRTLCGARIKTWEGGSGYARHISYDDITLIQVRNPISIDQHYWSHGIRKPKASAVKISDVRYSGFVGTSATLAAISLNCSETVACTNIDMDSIKITSLKPTDKTIAICENAKGTTHLVVPQVSCLKQLTSLPHQLEKNAEMA